MSKKARPCFPGWHVSNTTLSDLAELKKPEKDRLCTMIDNYETETSGFGNGPERRYAQILQNITAKRDKRNKMRMWTGTPAICKGMEHCEMCKQHVAKKTGTLCSAPHNMYKSVMKSFDFGPFADDQAHSHYETAAWSHTQLIPCTPGVTYLMKCVRKSESRSMFTLMTDRTTQASLMLVILNDIIQMRQRQRRKEDIKVVSEDIKSVADNDYIPLPPGVSREFIVSPPTHDELETCMKARGWLLAYAFGSKDGWVYSITLYMPHGDLSNQPNPIASIRTLSQTSPSKLAQAQLLKLRMQQVFNMGSSVCQLHSQGYANGDVKAENTMLDKDSSTWLIDWENVTRVYANPRHSLETYIIFSLYYGPPEVTRTHGGIDFGWDVWSMTATFIERICLVDLDDLMNTKIHRHNFAQSIHTAFGLYPTLEWIASTGAWAWREIMAQFPPKASYLTLCGDTKRISEISKDCVEYTLSPVCGI